MFQNLYHPSSGTDTEWCRKIGLFMFGWFIGWALRYDDNSYMETVLNFKVCQSTLMSESWFLGLLHKIWKILEPYLILGQFQTSLNQYVQLSGCFCHMWKHLFVSIVKKGECNKRLAHAPDFFLIFKCRQHCMLLSNLSGFSNQNCAYYYFRNLRHTRSISDSQTKCFFW